MDSGSHVDSGSYVDSGIHVDSSSHVDSGSHVVVMWTLVVSARITTRQSTGMSACVCMYDYMCVHV